MNSAEQRQLITAPASQPASQQAKQEQNNPLSSNLHSLGNILTDIIDRLNHQVLGNCEVLKKLEGRKIGEKIIVDNDEEVNIRVFQADQVNVLIEKPLHFALSRLQGLRRVITDLKNKADKQ